MSTNQTGPRSINFPLHTTTRILKQSKRRISFTYLAVNGADIVLTPTGATLLRDRVPENSGGEPRPSRRSSNETNQNRWFSRVRHAHHHHHCNTKAQAKNPDRTHVRFCYVFHIKAVFGKILGVGLLFFFCVCVKVQFWGMDFLAWRSTNHHRRGVTPGQLPHPLLSGS